MDDGFLLVDKPATWTSHDVIDKVRRIVGMRRVGHAGTLDPMATGLLVIGLGKATRLLRFIQELPKEYLAEVLFGAATDTGDADGTVTEEAPVPFSEGELRDAMAGFVGTIAQVPPPISAVKRGGRRAHRLTRAGVAVELEPRPVTVHELVLERCELPSATVRVRCGKGTYVRVLADDIARSLGSRAHLTALRRTAAGSLRVTDAWDIDALAAAPDPVAALIAPAQGLVDLPRVQVPDDQERAARHGAPVTAVTGPHEGPLVLLAGSDLIGVYHRRGDVLQPEVVVA